MLLFILRLVCWYIEVLPAIVFQNYIQVLKAFHAKSTKKSDISVASVAYTKIQIILAYKYFVWNQINYAML